MKYLLVDAQIIDYPAKNNSSNVWFSIFDFNPLIEVLVIKKTGKGTLVTTKRRYENCKDFDKPRLEDRPDFTVIKTYSNNWRKKRRYKYDNDNYNDNYYPDRDEEIGDWIRARAA